MIPPMPIQIALSSGSFYPDEARVEATFELARRCGFDGIELLVDGNPRSYQPQWLNAESARSGVRVIALHAPFPTREPRAWRDGMAKKPIGARELIGKTAELANAVGAEAIVLHIPDKRYPKWRIQVRGRMVFAWPARSSFGAGLLKLINEAELEVIEAEHRVRICLENMPRVAFFGREAFFSLNTIEKWAHAHRHLTLDTTHLGTWGDAPEVGVAAGGDAVRHIHLSDYSRGRQHLPVGNGALDLNAALKRFAEIDQAQPRQRIVSIELAGHNLPPVGSEELLEVISGQLGRCREMLASGGR